MDFKNFGNELVVWDFRERKVAADADRPAPAPLECRWSLKEGANHGFTNCALDNSIWVWEGAARTASTRPASSATPASCRPTCASRPTTATCS